MRIEKGILFEITNEDIKDGLIAISDEVIEVKDRALMDKKSITAISFADSVLKIGRFACANTNIKTIKWPNKLKIIEKGAFSNAKLESFTTPESTVIIEDHAFRKNNLAVVNLKAPLKIIGPGAFEENKLGTLTIPESIEEIGSKAFYRNKIIEIDFKNSNHLKLIGTRAFCENQIIDLEIPDSVVEIEDHAFAKNNITRVTIPHSVVKVAPDIFLDNPELETLSYGNIKMIDLNGIDALAIEEKTVSILCNNNLEIRFLNKNGIEIILNKKQLVDIFDSINLDHFKIGNLKKMMDWKERHGETEIAVLKKMPLEIMVTLAANIDNANQIKVGIDRYKRIRELANISEFAINCDLFKMCFALGLFSGNKEQAEYIEATLKDRIISKKLNDDNIHKMFDMLDVSKGFNPNVSSLILHALTDPYYVDNPEYIARINNEYFEMKKYIKTHYKEMIGRDILKGIKSLENKERLTSTEKKQLTKWKEDLKAKKEGIEKPGLYEMKYYIENHNFLIRNWNEELIAITPWLIGITQTEFDRIQDYYEQAKTMSTKNIIQTHDKNKEGYTYQWSKGDNPVNLVLGKMLECCAKVNCLGEDVMVQAMINPDLQNLIIRDANHNIVAKATVYYNQDEGYMLFNSAVASLVSIPKNNKQAKGEAQRALKRAVDDQVVALAKKGTPLNEVRIGMLRNDLFDTDDIRVVKTDLLTNYAYKESYNGEAYYGDANDPDYGQGILYKSHKKEIQGRIKTR